MTHILKVLVCLLVAFPCAARTITVDDDGPVELSLVGQLKTGQYFYGSDKVQIMNPGHINQSYIHKQF